MTSSDEGIVIIAMVALVAFFFLLMVWPSQKPEEEKNTEELVEDVGRGAGIVVGTLAALAVVFSIIFGIWSF